MDKIVDIDDVAGLRDRMLAWDLKLDLQDAEVQAAQEKARALAKAKWADVFAQIRSFIPDGAGQHNFVLRIGTGGEPGATATAIYGQHKDSGSSLGDGEIGDIEDVVRTMLRSRG